MALATWWSGDPLPPLDALPEFRAHATRDMARLARLAALDPGEVLGRLAGGHRPYIATLGDAPAAYGWVAGAGATIGELGVSFTLPRGDRYLWDFATLPAWRGRGIYPHLLRAIIAAGSPPAARLWIIHAPENPASARGIAKAGLTPVGELSFRARGGAGFRSFGDPVRAGVGAALLGVPLLHAAGGRANRSPTAGTVPSRRRGAPCRRARRPASATSPTSAPAPAARTSGHPRSASLRCAATRDR